MVLPCVLRPGLEWSRWSRASGRYHGAKALGVAAVTQRWERTHQRTRGPLRDCRVPLCSYLSFLFPFPLSKRYLKEFRVEQCKAFLQHKCNQHRPFTCFHWHFMNQRRRRPVKRRDGTFNYSPDVYCTLYDENTGICPNGDE